MINQKKSLYMFNKKKLCTTAHIILYVAYKEVHMK